MIQTAEFRTWISKVENKGNYTIGFASTSRDNKKDNTKVYSNWMIRFVGKSHDQAMEELMPLYIDGEHNGSGYLKNKIGIDVTRGQFTNEPYEKDGQKVYNNHQLVAWEWKIVSSKKNESSDEEPAPKKDNKKKSPSPFGDEGEDE